MDGWVKFHRKYLDSDLWLSEKFTKGQAWVDLFSLANHKDRSIWIRGIEIKIKRGQLAWSEVGLSQRWKWSRNKVRRFLKWLKMKQQINQQKTNVTTLISIVNYDLYQVNGTPNDTPNDTAERQQKDSKRYTDKNVKKEKNVKNNKNTLKIYLQEKIIQNNFIETKDKIFEFFNYRNSEFPKKDHYTTERKINGLFRNLSGCRDNGLIISECLDIAMENGWKTPNPDYFENKKGQPTQNTKMSTGDLWVQQRRERENAK